MEHLLVLAQFFIKRQSILLEHTCAVNAGTKMLYGLAKDHVLQGKKHQHSFADTMVVIYVIHIKQLEQACALVIKL
ncbi:uncharacterized protein RHIMIDRAFT_32092 [Rhizopus microsporus ATCC 52813]|uniref:Uncharacterized protein n=1 Tax=Rhizopus microsporus ATCC 52813 TaxID=1340429 RepID=A0A2G4SPB9_RHIZD|nr:uncharacterized protein RHIMIDRAFT_32092 [Rhizopus microsporus ATCC 52813]PHZ10610.1 hypothetical protein RHIMIDRAFT_32092 [Rhizopus microsporus ATCC 52813]